MGLKVVKSFAAKKNVNPSFAGLGGELFERLKRDFGFETMNA
jgi:hypothetical protein